MDCPPKNLIMAKSVLCLIDDFTYFVHRTKFPQNFDKAENLVKINWEFVKCIFVPYCPNSFPLWRTKDKKVIRGYYV